MLGSSHGKPEKAVHEKAEMRFAFMALTTLNFCRRKLGVRMALRMSIWFISKLAPSLGVFCVSGSIACYLFTKNDDGTRIAFACAHNNLSDGEGRKVIARFPALCDRCRSGKRTGGGQCFSCEGACNQGGTGNEKAHS